MKSDTNLTTDQLLNVIRFAGDEKDGEEEIEPEVIVSGPDVPEEQKMSATKRWHIHKLEQRVEAGKKLDVEIEKKKAALVRLEKESKPLTGRSILRSQGE
jgi:hypothetical protein